MLLQPHLVLINVVQGGRELVVVQPVLGQILDDEQFQFAQLFVGSPVVLREGLHIVAGGGHSLNERLYVWEERLLLVFHVAPYLVGILVVEAQNQLGQRVVLIERLLQLPPDIGQLEIQEIDRKSVV